MFLCQVRRVLTLVLLVAGIFVGSSSGVSTRISCNDEEMRVDISGTNQITGAYLQGLKNYPDMSCLPELFGETHLTFRLPLRDFYRCGTTQILNKITGTRTFYNQVVVLAYGDNSTTLEEFQVVVKCRLDGASGDTMPHFDENHLNSTLREKRDVLPAGFQEPETLTITNIIVGKAPEPMLSMSVQQEGRTIGQELIVQPGTPLTMEVSLDSQSREVYGILVSQLDVTDTGPQSEVILLNGCSVDPYLFENFGTRDGDVLMAKFRAFKFPDSNYIFFRGTVNVCLGSCQGINCRSGQIGYGRKRRAVMGPAMKNLVYEYHMTRILRIADPDMDDEDQRRAVLKTFYRSQDSKLRHEQLEVSESSSSELRNNSAVTNVSILAMSLALILSVLLGCSNTLD